MPDTEKKKTGKTQHHHRTSSGKTAMHRENQHRRRLLRKVRQRWRRGKLPARMAVAAIPTLEKYVRSLDRGPAVEWMGRRGVLPKNGK